MTLTRRGRIARNIAATLAAITIAALCSLNYDADAAPAPLTASVQAPVQDQAPQWRCRNALARTLYAAGFTGYAHKQAWAVVMRESNGQNIGPGNPNFNGSDWGVWQINAPAWGGQPWFTTEAMLDPAKQSRIAYRILTHKGTYWRPWGLTADGQLDASDYTSWGPDLWDAWIMGPFHRWIAQYPCKTTPPKKQ